MTHIVNAKNHYPYKVLRRKALTLEETTVEDNKLDPVQERVIRLRKEGLSFNAIGRRLKISGQGARKLWQVATWEEARIKGLRKIGNWEDLEEGGGRVLDWIPEMGMRTRLKKQIGSMTVQGLLELGEKEVIFGTRNLGTRSWDWLQWALRVSGAMAIWIGMGDIKETAGVVTGRWTGLGGGNE